MDDPNTIIVYDMGAISLALFVRKILIACGRLPNPKKTPVIVAKLASIVIKYNVSHAGICMSCKWLEISLQEMPLFELIMVPLFEGGA